MDRPTAEFVTLLTQSQVRLYGYVLSLVADRDTARDIVQQTNLVLWEKSGQFEPGSDFIAWAFAIARYEVLAHRRDSARDRLVFDDALMDQLDAEWVAEEAGSNAVHDALIVCLESLPPHQRKLIAKRYRDNASLNQLAEQTGKAPNTIAQSLHRTRMALLGCIRNRLGEDAP